MKILLLLKHIEKKIIIPMYFKDVFEVISWWVNFPSSNEWEIIYSGEREECGHRYELMYSKFDEQGKWYSKYVICFSKKEAVLLTREIKEANSNYKINVKRLY